MSIPFLLLHDMENHLAEIEASDIYQDEACLKLLDEVIDSAQNLKNCVADLRDKEA